MKISEVAYKRPDIDQYEKEFYQLLNQLEATDNFAVFEKILLDVMWLRDNYDTQFQLASIRYSQDSFSIANVDEMEFCLLYTSPSPRDKRQSRMPSSA